MKKEANTPCALSEKQNFYHDFWTQFNLQSFNNKDFREFVGHVSRPSIRCYEDFYFRHFFHIVLKMNLRKGEIQVGAYFGDTNAYMRYYENHRKKIEKQIAYPVEWTLWKTKGSAYVKKTFTGIEDKNNWEEIGAWFMETAIMLKRVFLSVE